MVYRSFLTAVTLTLAMAFSVLPSAQAQIHSLRKPPAAKPAIPKNTAFVMDIFGKVEMKVSGRAPYLPLSQNDMLSPQTTIRTGENSAVLFALSGGHYLRIGAKSVVLLAQLGKENSYSFKLLSGQVWSSVSKKKQPVKYEVTTPSTTVSGTGTLFGVGYDLESDRSTVSTEEGSVNVSLASGGWNGIVKAGQYIPYLRRPQPNIRLRAPEILSQNTEQEAMWKLLHQEGWTTLRELKMNRNIESTLQQDLRSAGGIQ